MDDSTALDSLELEVNDFGPIVNAKVDLRPLTVFVGPSNTGKSYLAILIYALHRFFGEVAIPNRRFPTSARLFREGAPGKIRKKTINALIDWCERAAVGKGRSPTRRGIVLPASVVDAIRAEFDAVGDRLGQEILRSFGTRTVETLVRKERRGVAQVVIRRRSKSHPEPLDHRLTIGAKGTILRTTVPGDLEININSTDRVTARLRQLLDDDEIRERSHWYWSNVLAELIAYTARRLISPLHLPAFYLPADRTGVMHAHSVVVSAIIGSAPMTGLRPAAGTPMLSGVLADFLQQLIELDSRSHRIVRAQQDLGMEIEETVLGGSVGVDRSETIDYPHFTYQPDGWNTPLPLMNASSMVSELAPVVLYLRYMVGPGNVLIIEEPESHLHPAMQVEFTRQIAALVEAGVRVIVTTHSEWVLEELANIVRRSELREADRKKMPRGKYTLRAEQVGAWLFKPKRRPKGSVVEEIRFDPDAGGLETDFGEVAQQVYNDWATIGNRIAGSTE